MIATDRISRAAARRQLGWSLGAGVSLVPLALAVALLVTCGVAIAAGPIEVSGWHRFAPLLKLLMAFLGAAYVTVVMPQHLSHGRTRGEGSLMWTIGALLGGVLAGLLVGAGYAVEGLFYRMMGWPQRMDQGGAIASLDEVWPLMAHYMLVLPTWAMLGALVAAAFAHRAAHGWAAFLAAIPLVVAAEAVSTQSAWSVPVLRAPEQALGGEAALWGMVAGGAVVYLAAALLTWSALRTIPMRPRAFAHISHA